MKIYLLEQFENNGWDTYSDCVVVAESEADAKTIHPADKPFEACKEWRDWAYSTDAIKVTEIGTPNENQKRGVVCASFHAG